MLAGICFLLLFQLARAQNKVITGVVLDDKGGPLSGATVRVRSSVKGVNTDADGRFTLSVPQEATVLVISYVGYDPQEVPLGNGTDLRVSLKPTRSTWMRWLSWVMEYSGERM